MRTAVSEGFTLVELLVCVTVISVLVAFAFPTFTNIANNSYRTAEANDLLGFFVMARQYSILNGKVVTLCPLDADRHCGRDWDSPLVIFLDPRNQRKVTSDGQVIRTLPVPTRGNRKVRSLSRSYFQYRPNGMIFSDLGNITWCPDNKDPKSAAHLIVSRGGRIRLAKDTNHDGIPNKANGRNVSCT